MRLSDRHALALLGALALPVLFYGLGRYSSVNMDEMFYHEVARHMVETGDWRQVVFVGELRIYDALLNAPLFYWAKATLLLVGGDSRWTMRLLSAGFGLASVLMTYRLVAWVATRRAGLLAGAIQLTTFQFVYLHSSRTGEMEPVLAFFVTLAAYLFLRAVEEGRSFVPHHACLLVLAHLKLPWMALPLVAEVACFALLPATRSRLREWLRLSLWLIPLAGAWRVYQLWLHWDQLGGVFGELYAEATGGPGGRSPSHQGLADNLAYYGRITLFGAFPFALLYPIALHQVLTRLEDGRERRRWTLLILYPVAIQVFFVAVAKRFAWYIVPLYPFLSAFLGVWLERLGREAPRRLVLAAVASCVALALWIRMPGLGYDPFSQPERHEVVIGWADLGSLPAGLGVALTALTLAAVLLAARRRWPSGFPRVFAVALTSVLLGAAGLRVLAPLRFVDFVSQRDLLRQEIDALRARGEPLPYPIVYEKQEAEPGFIKLRYAFGRDFWIVPVRTKPGSRPNVAHLYDRERGSPPVPSWEGRDQGRSSPVP